MEVVEHVLSPEALQPSHLLHNLWEAVQSREATVSHSGLAVANSLHEDFSSNKPFALLISGHNRNTRNRPAPVSLVSRRPAFALVTLIVVHAALVDLPRPFAPQL